MKCSLGISNFLEEISSLSHSVALLYFFALIAEEGFLISSCYSLELYIQMFISFLFSSMRMVLIPVSCTVSRTSVHRHEALFLSDLGPEIYCSFPLYNQKGFD